MDSYQPVELTDDPVIVQERIQQMQRDLARRLGQITPQDEQEIQTNVDEQGNWYVKNSKGQWMRACIENGKIRAMTAEELSQLEIKQIGSDKGFVKLQRLMKEAEEQQNADDPGNDG
jgi:hypothetical protein